MVKRWKSIWPPILNGRSRGAIRAFHDIPRRRRNCCARHFRTVSPIAGWLCIHRKIGPITLFTRGSVSSITGPLCLAGTERYAKAEVTAGGIDTNELSAKTMECRKIPGLFFIGEVVDVTGHLGGFNFQWAWASGFCEGKTLSS